MVGTREQGTGLLEDTAVSLNVAPGDRVEARDRALAMLDRLPAVRRVIHGTRPENPEIWVETDSLALLLQQLAADPDLAGGAVYWEPDSGILVDLTPLFEGEERAPAPTSSSDAPPAAPDPEPSPLQYASLAWDAAKGWTLNYADAATGEALPTPLELSDLAPQPASAEPQVARLTWDEDGNWDIAFAPEPVSETLARAMITESAPPATHVPASAPNQDPRSGRRCHAHPGRGRRRGPYGNGRR